VGEIEERGIRGLSVRDVGLAPRAVREEMAQRGQYPDDVVVVLSEIVVARLLPRFDFLVTVDE